MQEKLKALCLKKYEEIKQMLFYLNLSHIGKTD